MMNGYIVAQFKKPFETREVDHELFSYQILDAEGQHVLYAEDYIIAEMVAEALDLFPESEPEVIRFGIQV